MEKVQPAFCQMLALDSAGSHEHKGIQAFVFCDGLRG
jgi:hypothetical protein